MSGVEHVTSFTGGVLCLQRAPLASSMLKVKLLDMGDPRSLLSTALSPPNLDDIERTVLQLKEVLALDGRVDGQRHGGTAVVTRQSVLLVSCLNY